MSCNQTTFRLLLLAPLGVWLGFESIPVAGAPRGADSTTLYAFASEDHSALAPFEQDGDAFTDVDAPLTLDLGALDITDFVVAHDGSATRLHIVETD